MINNTNTPHGWVGNTLCIKQTASGGIASFADGADQYPVNDLVVNIEPKQEGSGDPSPDNVRPISGWTGLNLQRTGKNLSSVEQLMQTPYWGYDSQALVGLVNTLPVGTYTFSYKAKILTLPDSGSTMHGPFYITAMINGSQVPVTTYTVTADNSPTVGKVYNESTTFTITDENKGKCNHVYAYCDSSVHTGSGRGNYQIYDIQLEVGSTTAYEPYTEETYPITFPSSAGTVYGGTLDVTTGVLTVDRKSYLLNGTTISGGWDLTSDYPTFSTNIHVPNAISSAKNTGSIRKFSATENIYRFWRLTSNYIGVSFSREDLLEYGYDGSTAASAQQAAMAWYANLTANGIEDRVIIALATPQTYHLTPTEVKTLLKQNNIFADCGDVSVTYIADATTAVENIESAIVSLGGNI